MTDNNGRKSSGTNNWREVPIINPTFVDNIRRAAVLFKLPGAIAQLTEVLLALREGDPRFSRFSGNDSDDKTLN